MVNSRIIHLLCGGHNSGKTTFARYIQAGKNNTYRIAIDELAYSIGINDDDEMIYQLLAFFIVRGDIIIDTVLYNKISQRKSLLSVINKLGATAYAYVVLRSDPIPLGEYTKEEITESFKIDFPSIKEGFSKVMTAAWSQSVDLVTIGETLVPSRPIINVVEQIPDKPIVVKRKKEIIKRKLEVGRQNLFRPTKHDR